eukprot:TRINITY_DN24382_c0_g1_i1.p1 TRINITY_DN24382_c0_g1~~TRINITY_DN24382_c0_g1_i1.p1  ORF type:complete len:363 (-),score=95.60 TRINITY_DN24382_c0_g1_i1:98-1186(-)
MRRETLSASGDVPKLESQVRQIVSKKSAFPELLDKLSVALVETKAPDDEVFALFQRLIGEVNQEQAATDNVNYGHVKDCEEELKYRRKVIEDTTLSLNKASESKDRCDSSLTKTQTVLAVNSQVQQNKERELEALQEIRSQQRTLLEDRKGYHDQVVAILEGALRFVEELEKGAAKETTNEQAKNVSTGLLQLFSGHRTPVAHAVIQMLTQIMTSKSVNAADVRRLRELIMELRKSIEQAYNRASQEENAAQEAHEKQTAQIRQIMSDLKRQEASAKNYSIELHHCIEEEMAVIAVSSTRKRRNQQLLDAGQAMCETWSISYEYSTKTRQSAIQLYNKILEWLKEYFKKNNSDSKSPRSLAP